MVLGHLVKVWNYWAIFPSFNSIAEQIFISKCQAPTVSDVCQLNKLHRSK